MSKWQEMHNDNAREDQYDSVITQTVEIEVNNYVVYECKAEVKIFRGIPCDAEVIEMDRHIYDYDGSGELIDILNVCPTEFPHYIQSAAEKKLVERW